VSAGAHRRGSEPTGADLAVFRERFRQAMLTEPTRYLPPARRRRGLPHLESFLIGVICGAVPMLLTMLGLVWKGLITW
jgi:hypothetical protein